MGIRRGPSQGLFVNPDLRYLSALGLVSDCGKAAVMTANLAAACIADLPDWEDGKRASACGQDFIGGRREDGVPVWLWLVNGALTGVTIQAWERMP